MSETEKCTRCNAEFESCNNRQKYCKDCSEFIIKKAKREYIQKVRKQKKINEEVNKQANDYNARLARKMFLNEDKQDEDLIRKIAQINRELPPIRDEPY